MSIKVSIVPTKVTSTEAALEAGTEQKKEPLVVTDHK